jgi:hypothetical protein
MWILRESIFEQSGVECESRAVFAPGASERKGGDGIARSGFERI